ELYMNLLSQAVKELKGEKVREPVEVTVHITEASYIPEGYIPDAPVRLDAYRAIAGAENRRMLSLLMEEFRDRFGVLPVQVENLFAEAELSVLCRRAGVLYLGVSEQRLVLRFANLNLAKLERRWGEQKPELRFPRDDTVTAGIPKGCTAQEFARRLLQRLA
ncbi:MAG TPA: hypothetical protein ENN09_05840, partial [Planctomycetes bacterium]|nr:hypothetical protein [Planctomycetota bacterium]